MVQYSVLKYVDLRSHMVFELTNDSLVMLEARYRGWSLYDGIRRRWRVEFLRSIGEHDYDFELECL